MDGPPAPAPRPAEVAGGRSPGWPDACAGAVAAAVALGSGELVTVLDDSGTSLVSAVGDEVIDRFAASLKDIAVTLFGTNDKAALLVGIVLTALALGAVVGVAARRRPWVGPFAFAAAGTLGALAYAAVQVADPAVGIAAAAVAVVAGSAALAGLRRLAAASAPSAGVDPPPLPAVPMAGADRRTFLVAAGSLAAGAAALGAVGRRFTGPDPAEAVRASTVLPEPAARVTVPRSPATVPGATPYVTPSADFYRIDTALVVPRVDPRDWRLTIDGLVDRPFSLTFDDLLSLDAVAAPVTLACVSNEVGGNLVGNAVWQGVPLATLLDRAGVRGEAEQVVGRSVDGFSAGFPLDLATDGRPALVAYAMNGELLPNRHGFPARLVVSGLYGYVSATKWLDRIELSTFDVDGYWIPRGWAKDGPVKLASRIDVPRSGGRIVPGPVAVAGVAWAPSVGVAAVEVQVDGGPWQRARLGDVASRHTWVQWHLEWDATPGDHELAVRAVDADGRVQTSHRSSPAPDGATGHHRRRVRVA